MGESRAEIRFDDGRLALAWAGLAGCPDLVATVRLKDGTQHSGGPWRRCREGPAQLFEAECGPVRLVLGLRAARVRVRARLSAVAKSRVEVQELGLSTRPQVDGGGATRILYNGYQSWDPSGHLPIAGLNALGAPARRESWWTCGLADDRGAGLAVVASRARSSAIRFDVSPAETRIVWCEPPGLVGRPICWIAKRGDRWEGDEIGIAAGSDVRSVLAGLVAGGSRQESAPPRGWLSWYHHGPWISEEDVLENSAVLAGGALAGLDYRVIQIDDGWQHAYGDWRPNAKFSKGLASLSRDLQARGQVVGVWTAPFLVSASSDLAEQAPADWFLVDPSTGERAVDSRHVAFGPMYVLDARRPAVRRHLRETFAGLYDAGIRYFKIDFLYAGAYAGTRALREGLRSIRQATGDAYLLACGAPLLPVRGLVEGCRIGQDTASPIFNFELGAPEPTIFGDEVIAVSRNLAARCFLHGWFQLDPDVALVGGNLSLDQARQLVTLVALSGGPFFTSDNLRALSPERLALLTNPEVLALVGGPPAVPDWELDGKDRAPAVWRRGEDLLAVFNWGSEPRRLAARVPGRWRGRDLWEGTQVEPFREWLELELPSRGTRLIELRRA